MSQPSEKGSRLNTNARCTYVLSLLKMWRYVGELTADVGGAGGRTADQTRTGIWWAYDGGFRIGVPPRLYNQIVDDIIITEVGANSPQLATGFQLVRLYAMVNVALADSGIAVRVPMFFLITSATVFCVEAIRQSWSSSL